MEGANKRNHDGEDEKPVEKLCDAMGLQVTLADDLGKGGASVLGRIDLGEAETAGGTNSSNRMCKRNTTKLLDIEEDSFRYRHA